ncbi:MAG: hypothetical protein KAS32_11545 [Candidatus Peribacteraceae bacterium]|nr:hypothetical protein [Candidatus Peribacteraceae bacterium]
MSIGDLNTRHEYTPVAPISEPIVPKAISDGERVCVPVNTRVAIEGELYILRGVVIGVLVNNSNNYELLHVLSANTEKDPSLEIGSLIGVSRINLRSLTDNHVQVFIDE